MPLNGTFPYYSDGVAGEKYGAGNFKATNGRLYKVSTSGAGTPLAWYPAPGYLRDFTGLHVYVGHSGISQSATPHEIRCIYLNFNPVGLGSTSIGNRAHGFQLRCLSE